MAEEYWVKEVQQVGNAPVSAEKGTVKLFGLFFFCLGGTHPPFGTEPRY